MDSKLRKTIENSLASNDIRERRAALQQLAAVGLGNTDALALAISALKDNNANVRAEALRTAVKLAPEKAEDLLHGMLLDHHPVVLCSSIDIIRQKGLPGFTGKLVGMALYETSKNVKRTALHALIQLQPDAARSVLTSFLDIQRYEADEYKSTCLSRGNPYRTILDNVMLALEIAEEWSDPELIGNVKIFLERCFPRNAFLFPKYKMFHQDFIRQGLAAVTRHDCQAASLLVRRFPGVLKNSDLNRLGIGDQGTEEELRNIIAEENSPLDMCTDDLIQIDRLDRDKAMRFALNMLDAHKAAQSAAAGYFRYLKNPRLAAKLLPRFPGADEYWTVDDKKIIAAAALLNPELVFRKIIEYLISCENWEQRSFLARLLGKLGNPRNIHLLVPVALGLFGPQRTPGPRRTKLSIGRVHERNQAIRSIITLAGMKDGRKQILELLNRREPLVKILAIEILAELGDKSVIEYLYPLVHHTDLDVCRTAGKAIRKLGA